MAATGLQANWTAVSFNSTTITKVTSVSFDRGGQLVEFAGDVDQYPTLLANLQSKPRATVATADVGTLMGLAIGTKASLTATHKDAAKQSLGDIVYTMSNAVLENVNAQGAYGQIGSGTATFRALSADGATNPLSFTRA